jgi:hypothetical protein
MMEESEGAEGRFLPARHGSGGAVWPSFGLLALALLMPGLLEAQLASSAASASIPRVAPRVHIECEPQIPCTQSVLREEVNWVEWVGEENAAQIHVMVTELPAGEDDSARAFHLDFAGQGSMDHLSDLLTYSAAPDDEPEVITAGITQALRVGLLRFAVEAGLGADLALGFTPRSGVSFDDIGVDGPAAESAATYDPWDFWTFRAGLSGDLDIQESRNTHRFRPSLSADRVTEDWKVNLGVDYDINRQTIEFTNRTVVNNRDSWGASALVVRSISDHWSTGVDIDAGKSIQNNRLARVRAYSGIEWNYYPYAESTRRQLIAHYGVGGQYMNYAEETVFGVTNEILPAHKVGVQYRQSESWGNAGVSVDGSQYLHQTGLYSVGASGDLSFRVIRGLDFNISAAGEWIRDQIHIPAGDISDEDVFLGRQSLPTGYEYRFSVGLSYRWGSSFSSIVNSRFPSVSGGGPGGGGGRPF